MDLSLANKTALVCGGSQGIGRAAAMELAELGANVVLFARNAESLQQVQDELPCRTGQTHNWTSVDFSQLDMVGAAVTSITQSGPVHVLINNTGGPPAGLAIEATVDEFTQAFHNHLLCNQVLTTTVVPGMKAASFGRIINVISTSVKQPIAGLGVSNTIRGAVANWAKTLARELGPFGITVNNVLPGSTATGRLANIISDRAAAANQSEETITAQMQSQIPAGRFGQPHEIGAVIAFMASPAASFVNGINVPVDGGATSCL